jgi:hypothetical protein
MVSNPAIVPNVISRYASLPSPLRTLFSSYRSDVVDVYDDVPHGWDSLLLLPECPVEPHALDAHAQWMVDDAARIARSSGGSLGGAAVANLGLMWWIMPSSRLDPFAWSINKILMVNTPSPRR